MFLSFGMKLIYQSFGINVFEGNSINCKILFIHFNIVSLCSYVHNIAQEPVKLDSHFALINPILHKNNSK